MTTAKATPAPDAKADAKARLVIESGVFSQDTERLLISVMLNTARKQMHHSLIAQVAPDDFFVEQHKTIWQIICDLRDSGVEADPSAILDRAATLKEFVGGVQYVVDAVQDPVARVCSDESVTAAATRIKGFSVTRKLQKSLSKALTLCQMGQPFDEISSYIEDDITNLKRLQVSSRTGPRQAHIFYEAYLARLEAKLNGEICEIGVSTGYPDMDEVLGGGLARETLIVLAGRPSMGKTAFACAIEQNISNRNTPTLTFSLEMPGLALAQRNISRNARIPFKLIKALDIADRDYTALLESLGNMGKAPCYIDDTPGLTMAEIRSRARTFIESHPDGVIFIDYLQIIQPGPGSKDPRVQVSENSSSALQLARELKCPVVLLSQLNRGPDGRANKRPLMSDLKESGQIEQDAGVIMFIYRDEYYTKDACKEPGVTEAIFAKNRDGEMRTVKFCSNLAYMDYSELGIYASVGDE